jgi:hypothetical protein
MKNTFTEYLVNNGWDNVSPMCYKRLDSIEFELFFDSSNQIELYKGNERKDAKYLLNENDLILFLQENNLM